MAPPEGKFTHEQRKNAEEVGWKTVQRMRESPRVFVDSDEAKTDRELLGRLRWAAPRRPTYTQSTDVLYERLGPPPKPGSSRAMALKRLGTMLARDLSRIEGPRYLKDILTRTRDEEESTLRVVHAAIFQGDMNWCPAAVPMVAHALEEVGVIRVSRALKQMRSNDLSHIYGQIEDLRKCLFRWSVQVMSQVATEAARRSVEEAKPRYRSVLVQDYWKAVDERRSKIPDADQANPWMFGAPVCDKDDPQCLLVPLARHAEDLRGGRCCRCQKPTETPIRCACGSGVFCSPRCIREDEGHRCEDVMRMAQTVAAEMRQKQNGLAFMFHNWGGPTLDPYTPLPVSIEHALEHPEMTFYYGVKEERLQFFFQHQQLMWDALGHSAPFGSDPRGVEWLVREERCDTQWF